MGVTVAALLLRQALANPAVGYPGMAGIAVAFAVETIISFLLMTTVLIVSNSRLARYTGLFAAILVALYITFTAPLSGISMNLVASKPEPT